MTRKREAKPRAAKPVPVQEAVGMHQRVSVSFTSEQYKFLSLLAKEKKVSLAWVIRDAVDRLVPKEAPVRRRQQS